MDIRGFFGGGATKNRTEQNPAKSKKAEGTDVSDELQQSSPIDGDNLGVAEVKNAVSGSKRKKSVSDEVESPVPKVFKVSVASSTSKGLPFANMKIAITGVLESICDGSREAAEDMIMKYGGKVAKSISGVTTYLVAGSTLEDGRPVHESSKYRSAIEKKVNILTESEFLKMIPEQSMSPPVTMLPVEMRNGALKDNLSEMLWVDKYKPASMKDIIGCQDTAKKIQDWLLKWHEVHVKKSIKVPFLKENPGAKAILLSGPPGIGKTTMATVVGKSCGYELMELNASDARSKSMLDSQLSTAALCTSINGADVSAVNKKRRLIIMDEVDGMGGSDRGGIAELTKIIKASRVPIICICNDRQSPKIRGLANHCYDLRVRRPTKTAIAQRLVAIAQKEGLEMEHNAAEILAEQVGNDIRQVINASQMWRASNTSMKYSDIKNSMNRIEKDKVLRQSPFDACLQLLSGKGTFNERYDSFFIDYSLVPLLVQENYIDAAKGSGALRAMDEATRMERLSEAADAVSDFDIVGPGKMGQDMHWELLPVQAAFTAKPGSILQGFQAFPSFPKWLGKVSTTGKNKRLTQEIVSHTMEHIGQGFESIRLTYVPYLSRILTTPLLKDGGAGVVKVLECLHSYGLSRDDLMETLKELCFVYDKDKLLSNYFELIDSKVKTTLTKHYNESQTKSQALSYAQGNSKKSKAKSVSMSGSGEDDEISDVEVEDRQDDATAFAKKPSKRAAAKKTSSTKKGKKI